MISKLFLSFTSCISLRGYKNYRGYRSCKLYNYLLPFIYLLLLFSCHSTATREITILKIDSAEKIRLDQEFKEIKIIPLETNAQSLTGLEIAGLKCFQDRIYIQNMLQPMHVNLLCFNDNGDFLFKIDRPGRGPEEYTYFGDFFIDPIQKEICIVSENNRYLFFDTHGNYLYSKRSDDDYTPRQIVIRNGNYIAFHSPDEYPEDYDLFTIDPMTMNIKDKSKNQGENTFYTGNPVLCTTEERTLYYHFNDTIYDITDINNRKAIFYIDLGKIKSSTKKELRKMDESLGSEKTMPFLEKAMVSGKLSLITSLFENDSWITIEGVENSKEGINRNENLPISYTILYNKNNHKVYHSRDILSALLGDIDIKNVRMLGGDHHSLYWLVTKIFSPIEREKINNSEILSLKDKEYLTNRKDDENPFLIRFR